MSALIQLEQQDDKLSADELLAMCLQMLVGGHDTTTGLIGNGVLALLQFPSELEKLTSSPEIIATAVEEFLRFESPGPRNTRLVLEDMEIRGRDLREGQAVILMVSAANRDPQQFSNPDRLDVERQLNKHLAFGWGLHFCLGAPLARLEGQIAIGTLIRRLPGIRLADEGVAKDPPWRHSVGLRALRSLPVIF